MYTAVIISLVDDCGPMPTDAIQYAGESKQQKAQSRPDSCKRQ